MPYTAEDLSDTDRAQLEVMRLWMRHDRLEKAGDPGTIAAHADYIAARTAAEQAGHMMRMVEPSELRDRHSAILPPDGRIEIGIGWRPLVDDALDRLGRMQVVVPVIKEKFGALNIAVCARGAWKAEEFEAVQPAKAPAIEASITTCEACGAPGSLLKNGRWRTRCEAHVEL